MSAHRIGAARGSGAAGGDPANELRVAIRVGYWKPGHYGNYDFTSGFRRAKTH